MAGRVYTAEEVAGWEKAPVPVTAAPKRYTAAEMENWTKENADSAALQRLKDFGSEAWRGLKYSGTKPIANALDLYVDAEEALGSPLEEGNPIRRARDWMVEAGNELEAAPRNSGWSAFSLGSGAGTLAQFAAVPGKALKYGVGIPAEAALAYLNTEPEAKQSEKATGAALAAGAGLASRWIPPAIKGGYTKMYPEAEATRDLIARETGRKIPLLASTGLNPKSAIGRGAMVTLRGNPKMRDQIVKQGQDYTQGLTEVFGKRAGAGTKAARSGSMRGIWDDLDKQRQAAWENIDKLTYQIPEDVLEQIQTVTRLPPGMKGDKMVDTPGEYVAGVRQTLSNILNNDKAAALWVDAKKARNALDRVMLSRIHTKLGAKEAREFHRWTKPDGRQAMNDIVEDTSSQGGGVFKPNIARSVINNRKGAAGELRNSKGDLTGPGRLREVAETPATPASEGMHNRWLTTQPKDDLYKMGAGGAMFTGLGNMLGGKAGQALALPAYFAAPSVLGSKAGTKYFTEGTGATGTGVAYLAEALRRAGMGMGAEELSNNNIMPGGQ